MKFKRKALFVIMAATLLVAAACSSGGNQGSGAGSAEQPGGASSTPIASQAPVQTEPIAISLMGNYNSPELSESDKKFLAELEGINNVKLEFEIPPATGYNERLQLMLASGTYPDVVFFPNTTDQSFQNAVNDGVIIPVNEYLETAENLKEHTYQSSWDELKINQDENIYGIPRTSVIRNDAYWVRKDWLDKIGFEIPENFEITIEQFEEILRKFTTEDPDNNGQKDTFGYVGAHNANKVMEIIAPGAFGLTGWQEANGGEYKYMNPIYDPESENYKEALEFTQRMYTSGYFDSDSATNDGTKQMERFWRGMGGIMPGFAGHYTWHRAELQKNNPSAELVYLFVKDRNGEVKGGSLGTSSTGLWGFWAITTTAKDPQKVVDVLDTFISDEMWEITADGYEGLNYIVKDGAKIVVQDETTFVRRNSMRRANDINFFFSVSEADEVRNLVTPWLEKSLETVTPAKDIGFLPEAGKKPNFMDYKNKWDQTTMKIIMGEESVSAFDKLLNGWYSNGGKEYVEEMNEYIKKMESAK